MAESKRKSKKVSRKFVLITLLLIAAVLVALKIVTQSTVMSVDTQTVLSGTAEDKTDTNGYIIRGEYVVNAPQSGVISFRSDEGKRVSKGSTVAVIYSGEVSDEVKNELSGIHDRITEMKGSASEKNLYAGDSINSNNRIESDIDAISDAVYFRDTSQITQYKDDITRIIRKNGDESTQSLTTYEQLTARKTELESSISGSSIAVYAPISGVLSSHTDGYEEYFALESLGKITPTYLKNATKSSTENSDTVTKDSPCFKIINNYEWFYTATVSEKWAEDLKVNQSVYLRFPDISENKLSGTVYSISEPENGNVAVVVRSTDLFNGMYNVRQTDGEIIRKTYKGFKVSKEAIHIDKDGNYYVFINREGVARKRDVDILYSDDSYAIIKEDNTAHNNLLLYDEVVVSGSIEEGENI